MTTINDNPKITDTITFELKTTNTDDTLINPYKLDKIIIYFLARDFIKGNLTEFDRIINDQTFVTYFSQAETIKVFGNTDSPAWFSTDLDNAVIEKIDTGIFNLVWKPEFAREGDYIICWTWTPLLGDDSLSSYESFYLAGDTQSTTSIPTHFTNPAKYTTLLEYYTPEFLKNRLGENDLSPDVINKFNGAVADGFNVLEDLANQLPDLLDANAVHEQLLPYLANTLGINLRSNDITLWRRQVKRAIPLFKKKGTISGLTEALSTAGIRFTSLTRLWQVISPNTWQESFKVDDNTEFELANLAIITPSIDTDNFELYLRPVGDDDYISLAMDYVDFSNDDGVTTMSWIGDQLSVDPIVLEDGDFVKIVYKIAEPDDQNVEDYIRTLSLADLRDETEVEHPPKNWNVRVIEESDAMFNVICTTLHPFADPVVFGQIRTEFPYSENIYNMEEYNGSTRNSTNPCHLSTTFLDECSRCVSSKFNIDIEIENLSDSRIEEAESIIKDYIPFHAQIHTINYKGSISDFVMPPLEEIQCLVKYRYNDNFIMGQGNFIRSTSQDVKRNMLSTATVAASDNGTGYNTEIVLSSPNINMEIGAAGIIDGSNLLEILSGSNIGKYTVTNKNKSFVKVNQGTPNSISEPIDESAFTFRLSNKLYDNTITSIAQSDLILFSDASVDIRNTNVEAGWKITVTTGPHAGTYTISDTFPDDTLQLSSFPTTSTVTGLHYQLKNASNVAVGDPSITGKVATTRQGLVTASSNITTDFDFGTADYVLVGSTQYAITEVPTASTFYINGYTGGSVGVTSIKVYRRLFDNKTGYLTYNGMTLTTSTDYESSLGITNGTNGSGLYLEDSSAKENYAVLIGSDYYVVSEIDGTDITLSGPKLTWKLTGSSVSFSIIHVANENITIGSTEFYLIDRRADETITYEIETGMPMAVMAAALNSYNNNQIFSPVGQTEQIRCSIEYKE